MSTLCEAAWFEASRFAVKTFEETRATPIVVGQARGLFGSDIVPGTEEVIEDGDCGTAWITIKPARGPLIKWLKKNKMGTSGVYGGWEVGCSAFSGKIGSSQSVEKKRAAMRAAADVIKSYFPEYSVLVNSRID